MTHSDFFSPAQCLGYVALVMGVAAFVQKDDRRLKIINASQSLVYMVHFALLGFPVVAASSLISSTRTFLSLKTRSPWVAALMIACSVALGVFGVRNAFSYLTVVATIIATVGVFFMQGVAMRLAFLTSTVLWLTNNVLAHSKGGTILECIIFTTNSTTILRMLLDRRK